MRRRPDAFDRHLRLAPAGCVGGRRQHRLGDIGAETAQRRNGGTRYAQHRLLPAQARLEPAELSLPMGREIEILRPLEALRQQRQLQDLGDPVGAPGAAHIGNEVPLPRLQHETERIHHPLHGGGPAFIAKPEPVPAPDRLGDGSQMGRRDRAVVPVGRVEMKALAHPTGALAKARRHRGQKLEAGGRQGFPQPQIGGGARQAREGQRLGLLRRQARQLRAIAFQQGEAAAPSGIRRPGGLERAQAQASL